MALNGFATQSYTAILAYRLTDFLFLLAGIILTIYIAVSAFGLISNSANHYATFVAGIILMAALLSVRDAISNWQVNKSASAVISLVIAVTASFLAVTGALYIRMHVNRLELTQPFFESTDVIFGLVFTVGVLLLTLLHWGLLLTSIIAIAIGYFFYGHLIDNGLLNHPYYESEFVMNYIALGTTQGFFWLAQMAADSIYFLLIFASVLLSVGMLRLVLEVGKWSGSNFRGGAAFPAVIGSAIVGSVMGQAVSNVILTGRFTIPMMKKNNFEPSMAGAIEAVASVSGQIMPPILGLAGFIIAAFLSVPYIDIALASLLPALLFLSGTGISVLVYAQRHQIPRMTELPDRMLLARLLPTFVISFGSVLILLVLYYSPAIAGLAGIAAAIFMAFFQGQYRPNKIDAINALREGLTLVTLLSLLIIAIGPLGQAMITTNLAGRMGAVIIEFLPDSKILLLLGGMMISLFLGMGLPTPVAYVVVAVAVVPIMQQAGIPQLLAHLFVFYFAVFSAISLPVAVGVLAAAKLAQAGFLSTAINAMKIAATTMIIPFVFVYRPELTDLDCFSFSTLVLCFEVILIQWLLAFTIYGLHYCKEDRASRIVFAITAGLGLYAAANQKVGLESAFVVGALALLIRVYLGTRRFSPDQTVK